MKQAYEEEISNVPFARLKRIIKMTTNVTLQHHNQTFSYTTPINFGQVKNAVSYFVGPNASGQLIPATGNALALDSDQLQPNVNYTYLYPITATTNNQGLFIS